MVPPLYSASGWKFKHKSSATSPQEKVPIPDVLPIDRNGYWVTWQSVESCATKTWCRELVEPLETLTNPFRDEIRALEKVAMVDAADTLENLDS